MNIFDKADDELENFINNHLNSYHRLRNFDFGIEDRSNISQISKYTSHRILNEYHIIEKLKKFDNKKKYTDEILWRLYWKGYLENYKSIWFEYINFKERSVSLDKISSAIEGKTGINCFDSWIEELRENNYLHNHSRMWFASIWIFKLMLPWQLGARLFMRHLLDGDAASNTLSWRWVAGIHTNKKPYIATNENIKKFTGNRFRDYPVNLSENINIMKNYEHISNKLPINSDNPRSKNLIIFDNDMHIKDRFDLFNSYSKVYFISNDVINNKLNFNSNVIRYKESLIQNVSALIPNSIVLKNMHVESILAKQSCIDIIYPGIGHNQDFINKLARKNKIKLNYIYRDEDLFYWKYANSGFYKFKKSFYKLNNIKNPKP